MDQIYVAIENQEKKPALCRELLGGFRGSVLFLPSLLLLLLLSECFQYYQRFHAFIPSTPLLCLRFFHLTHEQSVSQTHTHMFTHTHTHTHTHVHAHMLIDTHNHPAGHTHDTNSCSETHTACVYASLRRCCSISSRLMFHQQDNTLLF